LKSAVLVYYKESEVSTSGVWDSQINWFFLFLQIMGPFNYAIVLSKSSPCFPNWGRVIEDIVTMAVHRKLIPYP
jgi:hypothetical protein